MLLSSIDDIKNHLKRGIPSPCYFVSGTDDHRRRSVVARLIEISAEKNSFDIHRFSGNVSADTVADAVFEVTFGGGRRCVLVTDLPLNSVGEGEYKKYEQLVEQTCAMGGEAVLIFTFDSVDTAQKKDGKKRDRFSPFKKLIEKSGGCVITCEEPSKTELCSMAEAAARKYHCTLDRSLAYYLIERCGTDSANLLNEVRKTAEYRGGGEITKADIDLMTSPTPDAKIYDLAAKISANNRAAAFEVIDELMSMGEKSASVLSALSGAFVDMYRAKAARASGKTADDILKDWNRAYARRAFAVTKALSAQQKYSPEALRECLDILLSAEQAMKGSNADDRIILEEAAAKIFAVGRENS